MVSQIKYLPNQFGSLLVSEDYLHFVFRSGQVSRGKITKVDDNAFVIKNALGHRFHLKLSEIKEIWKDKIVEAPG